MPITPRASAWHQFFGSNREHACQYRCFGWGSPVLFGRRPTIQKSRPCGLRGSAMLLDGQQLVPVALELPSMFRKRSGLQAHRGGLVSCTVPGRRVLHTDVKRPPAAARMAESPAARQPHRSPLPPDDFSGYTQGSPSAWQQLDPHWMPAPAPAAGAMPQPTHHMRRDR